MKLFVLIIMCFSLVYSDDEVPKLLLPIDKEEPWRLERTNVYFENDLFVNTDNQYTSGVKVSNIYFVPYIESSFLQIPFLHDIKKAHFISLGIAQQIFTPADTNTSELIVDDRPYAGWLYFEVGLHQSSEAELNSLLLQIGVIGRASGGEFTQKTIHKIRKIDRPKGWDNQLEDELGINLIYQHKWRYVPDKFLGLQSNIMPFSEASLGNVSTHASAGVLLRFGWNPIKDFGSSSIDVGGENGIPIRTNCLCPEHEPWSFTFNVSTSAKLIARDIFLDGNTFSSSHSIEKENFIAYISYGFSARYEHYALDYIATKSSEHFIKENSGHTFGTILFSYLY